jgi:hypothetical protein
LREENSGDEEGKKGLKKWQKKNTHKFLCDLSWADGMRVGCWF